MPKLFFDQWMDLVDGYVWAVVGCSVYDLVDCNFQSWYEDGVSAKKAAARALKEAGYR